jgi:hypothetical protein
MLVLAQCQYAVRLYEYKQMLHRKQCIARAYAVLHMMQLQLLSCPITLEHNNAQQVVPALLLILSSIASHQAHAV